MIPTRDHGSAARSKKSTDACSPMVAIVEHTIARLKNWRVLRDHRRRGRHLANTVAAVALLHNLQIEM
jgi:hypothetical protein